MKLKFDMKLKNYNIIFLFKQLRRATGDEENLFLECN
jgi:hypothetical protein